MQCPVEFLAERLFFTEEPRQAPCSDLRKRESACFRRRRDFGKLRSAVPALRVRQTTSQLVVIGGTVASQITVIVER
jgi:hypothetical protein